MKFTSRFWRNCLSQLGGIRGCSNSVRRPHRSAFLNLEMLETRVTPTVWTVAAANNADPAPTAPPGTFPATMAVQSLRQAVIDANANPATADETIQLEAATYSLTIGNTAGQENGALKGDLDITNTAHKLIIKGRGSSGGTTTTITATSIDRVLHLTASGVKVVLQDLIITAGLARDDGTAGAGTTTTHALGGAILSNGGQVTLQNVVITSNSAQAGTALRAKGGAVASRTSSGIVTISGSTFTTDIAFGGGNSGNNAAGADATGGAVYMEGGTLQISTSKFTGNSALAGAGGNSTDSANGGAGGQARGGAVAVDAGTLTLNTSSFTSNLAQGGAGGVAGNGGGAGGDAKGGAVFYQGATTLTVTASTFASNTANGGNGGNSVAANNLGSHVGGNAGFGKGGGLHVLSGTIIITNATLTGNLAQGGDGGDGFLSPGSAPGTPGFGFTGNGGALFVDLSTVATTLTHVTISGNSAQGGNGGTGPSSSQGGAGSGSGGGVFAVPGAGTFAVKNSIIAVNTAANGTGSGSPGTPAPDFDGIATSADHVLLGKNTGSIGFTNINGNQIGTSGMPINPLLDALKNNGGPTKTMALLPNSPALNAGISLSMLLTDQRGAARDQPPNIGAFEVQHVLTPVGVPTTNADLFSPHPNASANEAFVKGLYQAFLQRAADAGGLAFWVNELTTSAETRAQVAQAFLNSTENRTNQVTFFYQYILGRDPDSGGLNFYVNRLKNGEDEANIIKEFLLSPEFSASNDNGQFVNKLYYAVLGRKADTGGFNFWKGELDGSHQSRAQVALAFIRSTEGVNRYVDSLYVEFLKRRADSGGLMFYANSVLDGATFGSVAVGLLGGTEFFNNATANTP